MRVATPRLGLLCIVLGAVFFPGGCSRIPGRPGPGPEVARPDQVLSFPVLYKSNCSACHGANGGNGAAISLANPVYLAVAGEDTLRTISAKGVPGKLMPAFAKSAGGMLTDQQINVLVHQMMQEWGRADTLSAPGLPSYGATSTGDAGRGQEAFGVFCANARTCWRSVVMPRTGREGWIDRRRFLSCFDQRPRIAQYCDCGAAG